MKKLVLLLVLILTAGAVNSENVNDTEPILKYEKEISRSENYSDYETVISGFYMGASFQDAGKTRVSKMMTFIKNKKGAPVYTKMIQYEITLLTCSKGNVYAEITNITYKGAPIQKISSKKRSQTLSVVEDEKKILEEKGKKINKNFFVKLT